MNRGSSSGQVAIATERRPTKRPRRKRSRQGARSRTPGPRVTLATRVWRTAYRSLLVGLALVVALILALRFVDPPYTSFMAHARWDAWRRDVPLTVEQQWIAYRDIPDVAKLAVIAAEDQRFASHRGFDLTQIADALGDARRGQRIRGASTISQQTAKNLFLWPGQSWLRKGVEAALTVLIETLWPKRRILEVYLNVAEFGTGTYGLEAAAQRYFGKDASRLNRYECALLAAVLPNPAQLRADSPTPYLRTRQNWILVQMNRVASLDGMAALIAQRP